MRKIVYWVWEDPEKTYEHYANVFDNTSDSTHSLYPDLISGNGRVPMPPPEGINASYLIEHVIYMEHHVFPEEDE